MDQIIRGVHQFQQQVVAPKKDFYKMLAEKQQTPHALFITCADSRVEPNTITQTEPGTLFTLRNAGNIIPPHGAANGGEGATIEYAIAVLGVRNIIVCGHSQCGAMKALLNTNDNLPAVSQWFKHAEATRCIARERYGHLSGDAFLRAITEENVLVQLNNLSTHPFVTARMARRELKLYGWYYEIETGDVFQYDQESGRFLPLISEALPATPLSVREVLPRNGTYRDDFYAAVEKVVA